MQIAIGNCVHLEEKTVAFYSKRSGSCNRRVLTSRLLDVIYNSVNHLDDIITDWHTPTRTEPGGLRKSTGCYQMPIRPGEVVRTCRLKAFKWNFKILNLTEFMTYSVSGCANKVAERAGSFAFKCGLAVLEQRTPAFHIHLVFKPRLTL